MVFVAAISINPATIAGWAAAGLLAAWLASKMTEEPSYGTAGDFIGGGIGGLCGGAVYGFLQDGAGFWGGVLVAFIAAAAFIACVRVATGLRSG